MTGPARDTARDYVTGFIRLFGVDLEITSSSSDMSAEISANSGVLRYRSPVSGSMHRTVDPFGASAQIASAPAKSSI